MNPVYCEKSARILKVLGHPVRLKIAFGLVSHPKCVKEIWNCLGLSQAVASQHLAQLKAGGIIDSQRHGAEMHYKLIDPLAKAIIISLQNELDLDDRSITG